MLDFRKKYWAEFGPLCVRCSLLKASVNIGQTLLEQLNISEEAKTFFSNQNLHVPTAFPDDPESIRFLEEIEKTGYFVFYELDEPIGHDFAEYSLQKDDGSLTGESLINIRPSVTLEELRDKYWKSLSEQYIKAWGIDPKKPFYPPKKYGIDWFEFGKED